jgi:hypothetical protein
MNALAATIASPRPWAFATGSVTIFGRCGTAIDKHTHLHACDRPLLRFVTTGAGTIGADGMLRLPVEALLAGARSNLRFGTILRLIRDRDGLTLLATVNDPGLTGGSDGMEEMAPPPSRACIAAAAPALFAALARLIAIRPENWDDDDDPDQVAAWRAADEAIDAANGLRLAG